MKISQFSPVIGFPFLTNVIRWSTEQGLCL